MRKRLTSKSTAPVTRWSKSMRVAAMCCLGGGREAVGLGGLQVVAHVERTDVLHTLPASVLQEGKEGAERSAVSLPSVAVVDGSAQEMFDEVAGLAADSSPRHATGFPALLIGDCGLGDTSFSASDL